MKYCLWCDERFQPVNNQVYCSVECRTQATKHTAIQRRAHKRRTKRMKSKRKCVVCGAHLSMYGQGNTCSNHTSPTAVSSLLKDIRNRYENGNS